MMNNYSLYFILNLINGNLYIGQTSNVKERFRRHKSLLSSNKHHNDHLQSAWNFYGKNNFCFEVIQSGLTKQRVDTLEVFLIKSKKYENCCYNLSLGKDGGPLSEETKRKISIANKGRLQSDELKQRRSLLLKGRLSCLKGIPKTEEHKQKLRLAKLGKKLTLLHRKNIGLALKGRHMSDEQKKLLSKIKKGVKFTDEHIKNLKIAWIKRKKNKQF